MAFCRLLVFDSWRLEHDSLTRTAQVSGFPSSSRNRTDTALTDKYKRLKASSLGTAGCTTACANNA